MALIRLNMENSKLIKKRVGKGLVGQMVWLAVSSVIYIYVFANFICGFFGH